MRLESESGAPTALDGRGMIANTSIGLTDKGERIAVMFARGVERSGLAMVSYERSTSVMTGINVR